VTHFLVAKPLVCWLSAGKALAWVWELFEGKKRINFFQQSLSFIPSVVQRRFQDKRWHSLLIRFSILMN
jgi:hypothetical protein